MYHFNKSLFLVPALMFTLVLQVEGAILINTYTPTPGNPASGPYDSNITTTSSSMLLNAADYASRKLVDGVSAANPGNQTPQPGFTGTQPNFTDSNVNGFPDHGTDAEAMWVSHWEFFPNAQTPTGAGPINQQWVNFSLPQSQILDFMRVWNQNNAGESNRGVNSAYIWYSNDAVLPSIADSTGGASPGAGWTQLGNFTFAQASETADYDGESIPLNITAQHVLIDIESNHGGTDSLGGYVGLSEVQFFAIPEPNGIVLGGIGFSCIAGFARSRLRRGPKSMRSSS